MLVNILLAVITLMYVWIGMRLFSTAHENRVDNLYWLVVVFFLNGLSAPFAPSTGNPLGATRASLWLFLVPDGMIQFALIMFIHSTFYKNRKSPAEWFLGLTVIMTIARLYGTAVSPSQYEQSTWIGVFQIAICATWTWHGWAGYKAWRSVANARTVEDWVKVRYRLVIWYSICLLVASMASFVRIVFAGGGNSGALGDSMALLELVGNIGSVTLAYLAWAAPQGFYRWLNRNYKPPEYQELSEEEVMRQLTAQ